MSQAALLILALTASTLAAQQTPAKTARTYGPDANGVSLRVPAAWQTGEPLGEYLGTIDMDPAITPVVAVSLATAFPGSDFAGAEVMYAVAPALDAAACADLGRRAEGDAAGNADTQTFGGIAWTHRTTSGAAMMHQRTDDLYSTRRNGTCILLDAALFTSGYGAVDGMRRVTAAEQARVTRQLHGIVASVRLR